MVFTLHSYRCRRDRTGLQLLRRFLQGQCPGVEAAR